MQGFFWETVVRGAWEEAGGGWEDCKAGEGGRKGYKGPDCPAAKEVSTEPWLSPPRHEPVLQARP